MFLSYKIHLAIISRRSQLLFYIENSFNIIRRMTKNEKINFRCTEDECFVIRNTARECGTTMSDFCRRVVLNYRPKKRLTEEELELLREVRRITSDLQRIANFFRKKEYEAVIREVRLVVNKLNGILYGSNGKHD